MKLCIEDRKCATVVEIDDQGDRVLLYTEAPRSMRYHVIASPRDKVKVGDVVVYVPMGINFGYYVMSI